MHAIAFEFETEEEMREAAKQLWEKQKITGELEMFPTKNGRFRLHMYPEKPVRESVLEKIKGKRIQTKGSYGSPTPQKEAKQDD